ncbi:Mid2-like cell wall stress sensor domain protein [Staphylococcus gallinarum]|uniref:Mid2-like cell wall stress sensor domain protein n=1 Tax=Staphylococcus gallinarum TaxID=1293 RepID=A0A3A0VTY9_STAGA|nr:Mid2-like cell wall stress sensor domain protein [Staphylococcus gallinarum]RIP32772.1 Mid2-like cell wall stress sensor domain protein [Staphylococcus gallinarum]
MSGIWIVFAITVLIAVYSGITFITNLNSNQKAKGSAKANNNIYGIVFLVFLIIALIELFVFIV